MIERRERVLVTGSSGMVGGALVKELEREGFTDVLAPARAELELTDPSSVDAYFESKRPAYVFMVAARVGGIGANSADPVGFTTDNLKMALALFEACHKYKTKKNLFLGSTCIYPRECAQPMKEESLLTGPLEPTNEGYALAKIAGLKLAEYYHRQHGMPTVCPMPCNIYGTGDSFDLEKSHVFSALVRRFVDADDEGSDEVTLWGTGTPRREFIHVDDVASALLFLMDNHESPEIVNIGWGKDIPIKELAALIAEEVGFKGELKWDASMPDGMPRKCTDTSRLRALGFEPKVKLEEGIGRTVREYRALKEAGDVK